MRTGHDPIRRSGAVPGVGLVLFTLLVQLPGAGLGAAAPNALRAQGPPDAPEAPVRGTLDVLGSADPDWRLRTMDGRVVRLGEIAGRPLFVNMWATWCLPCVAELESIERLAASLEGTGIGFVLVSPERSDAVRDWVRRRELDLPVYVEEGRIPSSFDLRAIPTTWIVDGDGRIVLKHRGAANWDDDGVRRFLRWLAGTAG